MRSLRFGLVFTALAALPVLACEIQTGYSQPPQYGVQVNAPQPTAQVDVQADPNAQDPNAQQADPNAQAADPNDQDPSAIADFRDALAPYGQWADDPNYGTIWMPNPAVVGGDFQPYQTAGHWVYDQDYTWVSDYDWGWGPFHYGRWFQYPGRGWAWVPGKEYAGAWVTWRNSDDASVGAVGWAPTPPAFMWRGGQAVTIAQPWYTPNYVYVGSTDLFAPSLGARIIRDPVRIRGYEARTRVYEPRGGYVSGSGGVRMHVRGPEPARIGFTNVAAIPRPTAANNASLERARNVSIHANVRPVVGSNNGRTVTPTQHPIDTHTNNPQGHIEQHTNPTTTNVSHTEPQGGVHGGIPEHPQQVQHVEPPQQHTVQAVPTASQRPQVRPPPVQQNNRNRR
ncbi:MAG TPA: DUF6600 domain-containing protein [Polyangiaceae bacterium]|jgi:hypothetical protein|nr:DUF6600 domain-containing protein [Polyangiaceae bacterium]